MRTGISGKRDPILERQERFLEWIIELEGYLEWDEVVRFAKSGSEEYWLEWDGKNVDG